MITDAYMTWIMVGDKIDCFFTENVHTFKQPLYSHIVIKETAIFRSGRTEVS